MCGILVLQPVDKPVLLVQGSLATGPPGSLRVGLASVEIYVFPKIGIRSIEADDYLGIMA